VLWRWHPAYILWRHEVTAENGQDASNPDKRLAVTVMRKY
jgi:hypothetical protein